MVKDVDKILKRFLWCLGELTRGKAKVAWKQICKPKKEGSLGIKDFGEWNELYVTSYLCDCFVPFCEKVVKKSVQPSATPTNQTNNASANFNRVPDHKRNVGSGSTLVCEHCGSNVTFYHFPIIPTALISPSVLIQGSSLHVEKEDYLVSPSRQFTAGFHRIGLNAYSFAIWFSEPMSDGSHTFVWMANRDKPVNGKRSKFSLSKNGNLVLKDVNRRIWTTNTQSSSPLQLKLLDSGNLVLEELEKQSYLWQSFSFPTNTILPNQPFTKDTVLISSKSSTNVSSGFYKLYFDNDNVIRLLYNNDAITSVYWPSPWLLPREAGRSTYNSSRIAMLDSNGHFRSTDNFAFSTMDDGHTHQRRLTLDVDGNIRVYSLHKRSWIVSWQAISTACAIHGICGPNSLCTYRPQLGRICSCMHGYKAKNHSDSSLGCEPIFDPNQHHDNYNFIRLPYAEFYGSDLVSIPGASLSKCKIACLDDVNCKAFQFSFGVKIGAFECYTKSSLFNGYYYKANSFVTYLKLPKIDVLSYHENVANESLLNCSNSIIELKRTYDKESTNITLKFMLWFSIILGVIEVACFLLIYYVTMKSSDATNQKYLAIATGFRRFTYDEIMKASQKFRDEIGRGGGGVVYKGILPDNRAVAIKRLHQAFGEDEFLAEMNTIGRINHKNLIETYGYCAEGKHRILVYEYMENGSLAKSLGANQLDCRKRFEVATGVAKGLAYLHEECLEWVLHCDVKPHNILLDADYNPKVADFGLSKLFNQAGIENSVFSKIRGTRGYMAPEWVFNLPITSKVDVYSYGMVVLEMITGRSPISDHESDDNQEEGLGWTEKQIMDILDHMIRDETEKGLVKHLLKVALQCVEEDKDVRPTMSEVVNMLLSPEIDDQCL
ncbi:S-locus glycoprotein domain-containing protein [Artemisia annua]|uniref:Receptor-like serine/threonine-protein kinase n=1 Tax=Artemisia annua TaxID=35608 RepID=A0A2U1NVX8_ARTAN|nr:S-locus glycoprotein domain-containing protein [Artemisia annua]